MLLFSLSNYLSRIYQTDKRSAKKNESKHRLSECMCVRVIALAFLLIVILVFVETKSEIGTINWIKAKLITVSNSVAGRTGRMLMLKYFFRISM